MRALLVLALVSGCAAASPAPPGTAAIELGTGTYRFEPITDGDTIPLVHGAQGGWHFWLAVRATGVRADSGSLTIELQPADESRPPIVQTVGIRFDPPDASGAMSYLGLPEILSDPSCSVGVLMRVHATVTFPNGAVASDERFLTPGLGEYPPPSCAR